MSTWRDLANNPRLKRIYDARVEIIKAMREFFWSQNFIEADVALAVRFPSQEPYLNPIPISFSDVNGQHAEFFLHTSPEFSCKKLLAAGYRQIFSLGKCFRNNESFGGLHNPEFTMLEWYCSPGNYRQIMDDAEALCQFISKKINVNEFTYREKQADIKAGWERASMRDIWKKYLGVELNDYLTNEALRELAKSLTIQTDDSYQYEDLFYKIFLNKIELNLGVGKPIFIFDYPAQMCSFSRPCEYDARYAERFELYINGMELANAFGELTDAEKQLYNLEQDREKRRQLGKAVHPIDQDFIAALRSGKIQTASGIALGVDRLVMLLTNARDINEVIFQSAADQINK